MRALRPGHHRDGLRLLQARRPGQADVVTRTASPAHSEGDLREVPPGSGRQLQAYLELGAAMAIVGSSVVVGKVVVARVPVFLVGGLRLAFACVVLVPLLLLMERGWPRLGRRDLAVLGLQAFTGIFLFTTLLLSGLKLTSAAAAGIVTSTTPAVGGALAVLLLRERLTRARAGGIALAVVGILAINVTAPAVSPAGATALPGNLLVFGAVVSEAVFIICGRVAAARVAPLVAATTVSVLGFLMFLPFAAREAMRFGLASIGTGDWVALAYYGFVVTVLAFVLWARGLAVVPASTAAVFTAVLPLSAVLLSYAVLGEAFAWSHLLGGACVIGGIVLLAREPAEGGLSAGGVPVE